MTPKIINGPKGLKILICNNPKSLSTSLVILVRAGTDLENKQNNGISHFIEHLYFKGTKNFPNPKILLENIDKIGAVYNAFTSHQYTGFYLKVLPEKSEPALFILSDIILNPLFPEEEIEKEKKVIIEEINLYNDSPAQLILDIGNQLTFGDQPAGFSILGKKEIIEKLKRKDILDYVKKNYSTQNTIIVFSGKINNEKKLIKNIQERFKIYNSQNPLNKIKFTAPLNKYQEKIFHKQVDQAHIFIGFPLPGSNKLKDRRYALELLSIILGEKSSSRLWIKVREELGAAYYIRSHFVDYTNRSLFFVHAGLSLDRLDFILGEIVKEINRFKKEGPTEEEIEIAKTILKSALFMDLEESLSIALFYGRQYLLEKKLETIEKIIKKIDALKKEDLKRELKNLFSFNQTKFAIILPPKFRLNFSKIFQNLS